MLTGLPPFYSNDKKKMIQMRIERPIELKDWLSYEAKGILTKLLVVDPLTRLGANGSHEIKTHQFFKELDWEALKNK